MSKKLLDLLFKVPAIREWRDAIRREAFMLSQKDFMETMGEDIKKQADDLAEKKLAAMLSVVDQSMVLMREPRTGAFFTAGKQIDNATLENLKAEARLISQTELWKMLVEGPKELAQKAMFMEGDSIEQMRKGRAILYTLRTQEKTIELLLS